MIFQNIAWIAFAAGALFALAGLITRYYIIRAGEHTAEHHFKSCERIPWDIATGGMLFVFMNTLVALFRHAAADGSTNAFDLIVVGADEFTMMLAFMWATIAVFFGAMREWRVVPASD